MPYYEIIYTNIIPIDDTKSLLLQSIICKLLDRNVSLSHINRVDSFTKNRYVIKYVEPITTNNFVTNIPIDIPTINFDTTNFKNLTELYLSLPNKYHFPATTDFLLDLPHLTGIQLDCKIKRGKYKLPTTFSKVICKRISAIKIRDLYKMKNLKKLYWYPNNFQELDLKKFPLLETFSTFCFNERDLQNKNLMILNYDYTTLSKDALKKQFIDHPSLILLTINGKELFTNLEMHTY